MQTDDQAEQLRQSHVNGGNASAARGTKDGQQKHLTKNLSSIMPPHNQNG